MKSSGLKRTGGLSGGGLKKSNKRINPYGEIARKRAERKKEWQEDHPPLSTAQGQKYYHCHICVYFGETKSVSFVKYEQYVLEHIIPKGNISFEKSQEDINLGPAHAFCNNVKGSMELWQMEKSPISGIPNPHI